MQDAETVLSIVRDRGRRRLPLAGVYRQLYNPALYLLAYGNIHGNAGAMTPGATEETVDGMSREKIGRIVELVRAERYRFTPVRRVYIEKKTSTKKRPLGIPTWSDKLVQEVLRLLLEAYYEPRFSDRSHGFRPNRGCHTALREIHRRWRGTAWFIEGDTKGCFDSASCYPFREPAWLPRAAVSLVSCSRVAGVSGNRYNPVAGSLATAIVPFRIRS
jgi:retron-type reverse transcriptase